MILNLLERAKDLFFKNTGTSLEAENVQDAIEELNNNVKSKGSATQPVYFDENGVAQPITHINASGVKANYPQQVTKNLLLSDFVNRSFIDNGNEISTTDCNLLKNGGNWVNNVLGNWQNAPAAKAYCIFQYSVYNSAYKVQIAVEYNNNDFNIRTFNNEYWSSWRKIY